MSDSTKIMGLAVLLVFSFLGADTWGSDPGAPDTVSISGGPLVVDQSNPLYLTIVNDEILGGYCLGFEFTEIGGGFAVFDSAVYINRMEDPSIFVLRILKYSNGDNHTGESPDTLIIGGDMYGGNTLPAGNDPIIAIYFTGLTPGSISIDSTFFPPAGNFLLCDPTGFSILPEFIPSQIDVLYGNPPPVISHLYDSSPVTAGETISFEIDAESPDDYPVELQIVSLTGFDDSTMAPVNAPILSSGDPANFSWVTTSNDIGIWKLVIEACDSTGTCASEAIILQVVEADEYILTFDQSGFTNTCYFSGLTHGNFDGDINLELVSAGTGQFSSPLLQIYDYQNNVWGLAYSWDGDGSIKYGPHTVYLNNDKIPDIILMAAFSANWYVEALVGDGDNGFSVVPGDNDGSCSRNITVAELTGDNYLDVASIWTDGVHIFAGDSNMQFTEHLFFSVTALGINSADFDNDGNNDLAVGCDDGIRIYLGDGAGGFDAGEFYSQTYGSIDIEVTNQGSDFNNDDIFDLCVSTPSQGGASSEMMIYLGNGDGTFEQHVERSVKGHIFGNCVGDFNSDGELDIAYVNGSQNHFAILFGDGDGSFTNEIRMTIPHTGPRYIDCYDYDLDGDLDIMAATVNPYDNRIFFFENGLDPDGFAMGGFDLFACNNADIELTSASGRVFNRNRNTMPSGEMYHCNLDSDNELDIMATMNVMEQEEYILQALPKPGSSRTNFTLEFDLNGQSYRLAHDIPMISEGYTFNICLGQNSPVYPRPGKYSYSNPPTFSWQGEGSFDFQLAADIDFYDIIISTIVNGNSYQYAEELPVTDITTYYWRIRPAGQPEFENRYVLNLLAGSPGDCGDANSDGNVNVSDAVFLINYVFINGDAPDPLQRGDANCDGSVNVSDAVVIINYVFAGGNIPCDTNGDGLPDC
jgi:hypothetical protein